MTLPQPGIFAQGTRFHHHLEFELHPRVTARAVAAALRGMAEPPVTTGGANLVLGFGPGLWRRMAPNDAPATLAPARPIKGYGGGVPATQHDVWVWIHGSGPDVALDVARAVGASFATIADLALEQVGFVYGDSRDLTGFIDGTQNPPVAEAGPVALVPDDQPGAGGSFAFTMRWVHDLTAFHALTLPEQDAVFGRTKADSIEMDEATKPATAHIARVVVDGADGKELEIYRRSVPYGDVREHGLHFVAFSADPSRFDIMLARMFGLTGDHVHDRLVEFSRPVTFSRWFVPSQDAIGRLTEVAR